MQTTQSMLDHEHVREKMKELKEQEQLWENKKELRRQLQQELDEMQKKLTLLNNELKTKQALLKRFSDKSGNMHTMDSLRSELELRDNQISTLEDRLITLEFQQKFTQEQKAELDRLKLVENQLLNSQASVEDLRKKCMMQEGSISGWLEDSQRNKIILKDRDAKVIALIDENTTLIEAQNQKQTTILKLETQAKQFDKQVRTLQDSINDNNKQIEKLTTLYEQSAELREKQKLRIEHLTDQLATEGQIRQNLERSHDEDMRTASRKFEEERKAFEVANVELKVSLMKMYGDEKRLQSETFSLREARIKVLEQKLKDATEQLVARELLYKASCEKMDQLENNVKFFKNSNDDLRQTISTDSRVLTENSDDFQRQTISNNGSSTVLASSRELDLVARISLFQIEVETMIRNDRTNLQRITQFQATCRLLEENLTKSQKDSLTEFQKYTREIQLLNDKLNVAEKSYMELRNQYEDLLSKMGSSDEKTRLELLNLQKQFDLFKQVSAKVQKDLDDEKSKFEKQQQDHALYICSRDVQLKQVKDEHQSVQEVNSLQSNKIERLLNDFQNKDQQIKDQASAHQLKDAQITEMLSQIEQLNKQLQEVQLQLKTSRKQAGNNKALQELQKRAQSFESEVEVLKEMVRSSQTQIKSKDVDIQRLQIKIKRLEKEVEMGQNQQIEKSPSARQVSNSQLQRGAGSGSRVSLHPTASPSMLPPIAKPAVGSIIDSQQARRTENKYMRNQHSPVAQSINVDQELKRKLLTQKRSAQVVSKQQRETNYDNRALTQQDSSASIAHNYNLVEDQSYEQLDTRSMLKRPSNYDDMYSGK